MEYQNHVVINLDGEEGYVTLCAPCSKQVGRDKGREHPEGEGFIEPFAFAQAESWSNCEVCGDEEFYKL